MSGNIVALAMLLCVSSVTLLAGTAAERLGESATVLKEVMDAYSRKIENKAILNSGLKTPVGAEALIALLNRYSRKET